MKKLKRKSLEELRTLMPVINESEQKMYNGGTVYCDLSGYYLGKVGSGNDLKFCSISDFENFKSNNIEGGGISFSSLNNAGQYTFIVENSSFNNAQISKHNSGIAAGLSKNGILVINESHSVWNNYNDALSTLQHESYHFDNGHYKVTGVLEIQNEIETYLYQVNSSGFASTSESYKKQVAEYLYSYYQQKGESVSLQELYRLVGVY